MPFQQEKRGDLRAELPDTNKRLAEGKIEWTTEAIVTDPIQDELGSSEINLTADDFVKVMRSVLANDGQPLQTGTVSGAFQLKSAWHPNRGCAT